MRKICYYLLLLGGLFTIFYCTNESGTRNQPPSAVQFFDNPADTSLVERGIDAVEEGNFIKLQWQISADQNVTHYAIHRSEIRDGTYQLIGNAGDDDSTFIDGPLQVNTRYYYYVRAVTAEGLSSVPSDTLDYRLLAKAVGLLPSGNIADFNGQFSWQDPNQEAGYVLRLYNDETDLLVWIVGVASTYSGDRESVNYNFDGRAALNSLEKNTEYRFRIDVTSASENSGSESQWTLFKIL